MAKKFKVFVTRKIPKIGIETLRQKAIIKVSPHDRILKQRELIKMIKGKNFDALLTLLTDHINDQVLDAAGSNLKIVANYAVGFDNIDLKAASKRKIYVTNTPGVLTEAVAEHAFALLLAASRKITESDKYVRGGKYKGWEPMLFLGKQLHEKTLGVVGLGRIGSYVAQIARGFNMKVIYFDIARNKQFERKFQAYFASMPHLLKEADFISIHVPLVPQTHHLIKAKHFKMMKNTAILINTSRGPVIDEKALVYALRRKEIAAAGLDVFEHEPHLTPGLKGLKNVILTPHTASATIEARNEMAKITASNILAVLEGKKSPNLVNKF